MNYSTLVKNNLNYFRRANLAVILGVATAVAVLAGALLVGDSVRASLRDLALSRLGKTDYVVVANSFFREQFSDELAAHNQFTKSFDHACPLIAIEGVVTRDENNARAGGVQVYGVDERFWKFHGVKVQTPDGNDVLMSSGLARELGAKPAETILLRIEKPSAVPAESLHGRKDDLGRTIRFTMRETLPAASLGEFSLRPQQGSVRAIFVPLKKLQKNLEQAGKANVILLSAKAANAGAAELAGQILKEKFKLADLGLKLRTLEEQKVISLESEGGVVSEVLSGKAIKAATDLRLQPAEILTYLANELRLGDKQFPYSLITAVDQKSLSVLAGESVGENQIVLNEWAASDLGAKVGDTVSVDYYVWREEGILDTEQSQFQVARITPLVGLAADRQLAPDYPGITEAKSLADWDPPFPVDLSRVRPKDEEYWDKYRTTPKAFIRLEDGQRLWATRYGKLTSIRLAPTESGDLESVRKSFEDGIRSQLDPAQLGLTVQSVKEQSLQASRGATDFGEYFTYFSFFLVVSALLLTTLFFRLGIEQRLREIGLLRAIGFSIKQVRGLFLREGFVLAVIGSLLGLIGAIAYGGLMMYGLRTWWVGAVGTTLLRLHVTPQSLLIGGISGVIAALLCVWWTIRKLAPASPRSLLMGTEERGLGAGGWGLGIVSRVFSAGRLGIVFGALGLVLLVCAAMKLIGQVSGFFGAGTLLLIAILCFWSMWLRSDKKQTIDGRGLWPMARMGFRNATSRPGRSVLCIALIASAAFIIVSVDAFRRDGRAAALDKKSGNGGYPLLGESLLPIVHDPNSEQGREELNLSDEALRDVTLTRFRLRPGDDASCLNLYQPRNPRILGAAEDFIKRGRFAFQTSLGSSEAEKNNPWFLLNQETNQASTDQSAIPVIADANSMTYVLHKKLGDEITVNASNGYSIKLVFVAALSDSIFQGELLMSEKHFLKYFPDQEGYRFFLIDAPPAKAAAVAAALEDRLSDFGFDAASTEDRLASFHQVENTYLSTFQTLGGLGLLLGTLGLGAVLLRNVLERKREVALMRAVGFRGSQLALMIIAENALLLGCGLLTGVLCALLAIAPAFIARGGRLSIVSLGLLLLAVLITGLAASLIAVRAVVRAPLIPSLRTE